MDKNESKTMDLGRDNVTSLFFRLFFPTLLGLLSMAAVTAINGAFIGHGVGSDGLAAVNITVPLWMVFSGLGLMFGAGCSVVASSMLANSDANAAKLHVAVAFSFASAITIAVSVAVMCFPAATARLFGASEHLLPLVRDYLALVMPCFVFQMWSAIGLFIIRLDGAPKVAMWCNIITAILTLGGDYMMIYVCEKGLQGVAVSTCVGNRRAVCGYLHSFFCDPIPLVMPIVTPEFFRMYPPKYRISVQNRFGIAVRRTDACCSGIRGQLCFHALSRRQRCRSIRYRLLLYAFYFYDFECNHPVGTTDYQL